MNRAITLVALFAFFPGFSQDLSEAADFYPTQEHYSIDEWQLFEKTSSAVLSTSSNPQDSILYLQEKANYLESHDRIPELRDNYTTLIQLAEKHGFTEELAYAQLRYANLLTKIVDAKNAQHYITLAEGWYSKQPWSTSIDFYVSLANFYEDIEELELTIETSKLILEKLQQDSAELSAPLKITVYNLLSMAYYRLGQNDSTYYYTKLCYDFAKTLADSSLMTDAANNMAVYYSMVEEDDLMAEKYLREALRAHKAGGDNLDLTNTLKNLSYTLYYLERYEEAFNTLDSAYVMKDSIVSAMQVEEIVRLEREFNYERESQEKLLAQQDAEEAKVYSQLLGALVLILALAGALGVVLVRVKSKERQRQLELKDARISSLLKATELEALNAELEGQNNERKRIAQELHDRLGSLLAGTKMQFTAFASKVNDEEKQAQIEELLKEAMAEVRNVSHNLYNPKLLSDGLAASIKRLCETVNHEGLSAEFTLTDNLPPMSNELKSNVFKIFQELLTNILKHANASSVSVSLALEESDLVMRVSDNGKGFDTSNFTGGLGLNNIQERAALIGGSVNIDSTPGKGTVSTLRVTL